MVFRAFTIEIYIKAKKIEEAFDILEELSRELQPPLDNVVNVGYMFVYVELDMVEEAELAMAGVEELAKDFGEDMLLTNVYYAKGMVSETKEEYDEAIENYEKYLELEPTGINIHRNIGRCFRKLGKLKDAEEQIQIILQNRPFNPKNSYEAALLYLDMGDNEKAIEYLKITNDIWKDADEDYDLANEAREKLEELVD
jgi:tetratricopeptide (TPR) repeat protein